MASLGLVREGANPVCDPLVRETAGIKAELYREISKAGLPAMPGATEFVRDAAAELGARKIAIVTTAADVDVDSFLDHHGIRTSVGFAITSGFRGGIAPERLKPDPYAYQQAARLFGVATRSTVAVEDSPIGIAAAVGAHMSVVGIATTHNREDLTKAGMVVDDFAGLREIVLPKIANVR